MIVHQQLAFLRPKKLILTLFIPICTPFHTTSYTCVLDHI